MNHSGRNLHFDTLNKNTPWVRRFVKNMLKQEKSRQAFLTFHLFGLIML